MISDGTIVTLPRNRKKGIDVNEFIDNTVGKPGSNQRNQFESELKMEVFQELIKAARKKRNLSQEELGQLIGVKKSQISKLEKGYENTSIITISKVFNALKATVRISVEIDGQHLEL
ncbi:XRE family transcriptional regulator [Mucilaginibacter terrigena]|uniref:XRE family transcriptional regulator n=2 Tax=Mucilaginibacter terrigena TaxID=2492395 RepID=A0A4Q5LIB4_9SPHI|nr:XRE family transcriptional regulator [Mucilaginibacter terrigena]